jgi:hypothetical protein
MSQPLLAWQAVHYVYVTTVTRKAGGATYKLRTSRTVLCSHNRRRGITVDLLAFAGDLWLEQRI